MADKNKPSPGTPKTPGWFWDPDPKGRMTSPEVRRRLGLTEAPGPQDRRGIVGFRIPPSPRYAMEQALSYEDYPTVRRLRRMAIPETARLEPRQIYSAVMANPLFGSGIQPRITRRPPRRGGRRQ